MATDSSAILNAIIAKLSADQPLLQLMPDSVWEEEAPVNAKRFVIVRQVIAQDKDEFQRRGYEDLVVRIEARTLVSANGDVRAAANRIDLLMDPQGPGARADLDVPGYRLMVCKREEPVRGTEVDDRDATIRYKRRGGQYRIMMAVVATTA